ncbi:hypothetical protein GCK72_004449 [Caenorhabditis remanei]|uniref:PUM-HD domain-containing protein n=1 Tax=Caenorhabditis remanei TaxID=31234 RepID=A0A6A5HC69_CAERE|nr:hypothetical protein GCK72_004449 [Caenorhabditis remanei]KAF1764501.1 hypothetical protein GCK72_004449 [Caenorhabditis remanei]
MYRDTFSNSRRARHFGRSTQNNQQTNNQSDYGRSDNHINRRHSRDTYPNEGDFNGPPSLFNLKSLMNFSRNNPDAMIHPFFGESSSDLSFQLSSLALDENNNRRVRTSTSSGQTESKHSKNKDSLSLPSWVYDENHEIRSDLTLRKVVDKGLIPTFAMDKSGCHFLQSNYYGKNTQNVDPYIRERIARDVLSKKEVFLMICKNIFGNFFLQRVIEYSNNEEQDTIKRYIVSDIAALCLDKYACRVVQTALERLEPEYADAIVAAIPRKNRLMAICTDQNANHVIQKIIKRMGLSRWEFLITYLCKTEHDNLLDICEDKYGCRVVQTIVEVLSNDKDEHDQEEKAHCLRRLMNKIMSKCQKLASNEFANYIIQHIIDTPGILSPYRDLVIETCLLRNLLSMSQEKYASHVIERAFELAPLPYIAEMMEEIFDGYVPHPETGKDALDILMFHQFGNYVVQRILRICVDAALGDRPTLVDNVDYREKFDSWLSKLYVKVRRDKSRLTRFSSGKKIIDLLERVENAFRYDSRASPYSPTHDVLSALCPSSFFSPPGTSSVDWPSRASSVTSEHPNEY